MSAWTLREQDWTDRRQEETNRAGSRSSYKLPDNYILNSKHILKRGNFQNDLFLSLFLVREERASAAPLLSSSNFFFSIAIVPVRSVVKLACGGDS